jgi:UDP-N-acetylglucosamine 2-epimerase (non-hydrolysing)
MKTVHLITAARPNFMKVAPLYHALKKTDWCNPVVVHVRQHKDDNMSGAFLVEFGIPNEDLVRLTGDFYSVRPDAVVIVGDVNTSADYAVKAARLGIPVVHLEAGLRSFDRSMPEEINRVVIDAVSDLLWAPTVLDMHNLYTEGVPADQVVHVGNIMIDTFEMLRQKIEAVPRRDGPYAVVTLHRPSNVDDSYKLLYLLDKVWCLSKELPVVFPVHPRTRKGIKVLNRNPLPVELVDPMPYVEFMALVKNATIVITDSGGVQEETSYLGVPCATVRENTERPITISHGTNRLISPSGIVFSAQQALAGAGPKGRPIPLWDGKTAGRCVESLRHFLGVPQKGLDHDK